MGKLTNIGWCDATQNFWQGCFKVSEGCAKCYMYRDMHRWAKDPRTVIRSSDATFYAPLKWKEPLNIFTCSWSDFFIEEADEWRADAWEVIRKTPQHTYIILTKRIERVEKIFEAIEEIPGNIILGISAENEKRLLERWPFLEAIARRFHVSTCISFEPLLSGITSVGFTCMTGGLAAASKKWRGKPDWIITGGESDLKEPRMAELQWFKDIRDFCIQENIPFFHKQHGGKKKIDGVFGGRVLDDMYWNQLPPICQKSTSVPE